MAYVTINLIKLAATYIVFFKHIFFIPWQFNLIRPPPLPLYMIMYFKFKNKGLNECYNGFKQILNCPSPLFTTNLIEI